MDQDISKYAGIHGLLKLLVPKIPKFRSYNSLIKLLYKHNVFEDNKELEAATLFFVSEFYNSNSEWNKRINIENSEKIYKLYLNTNDIETFISLSKEKLNISLKNRYRTCKYKDFDKLIDLLYKINFFKSDIYFEFQVLDTLSDFYRVLNSYDKSFIRGSSVLLESYHVKENNDIETYIERSRKALNIDNELSLFEVHINNRFNEKEGKYERIGVAKFLETTPLYIQSVNFEYVIENNISNLDEENYDGFTTYKHIYLDYFEYFHSKKEEFNVFHLINSLNGKNNVILANTTPIETIYNIDLNYKEYILKRVYFFKSGHEYLKDLKFSNNNNAKGRLQITHFDKRKREKSIQELIKKHNYKSNTNTVSLYNYKFKIEFYITDLDIKKSQDRNYSRLEIKLFKEEDFEWFSVYVFGEKTILYNLVNCIKKDEYFFGLNPRNFQILYIDFLYQNYIDNYYIQNIIDEFNFFNINSYDTNYSDRKGRPIHFYRYMDFFGDGVNLDLNVKRRPNNYIY